MIASATKANVVEVMCSLGLFALSLLFLLDERRFRLDVALADGSRRGFQAIEVAAPLWHRLRCLLRRWLSPGIERAACGLAQRFQQLLFVIDHLCRIVGGQFIFLLQRNRAGRAGLLAVAAEDA